jgi:hypothetical protein
MGILTSVRRDLTRQEALSPRAPRDPLIERVRLSMGAAYRVATGPLEVRQAPRSTKLSGRRGDALPAAMPAPNPQK